jgi:hypothetical protein
MSVYARRVLDLCHQRGLIQVPIWIQDHVVCLTANDDLTQVVHLGPCECTFGHAKLSGLRESFQWCVCNPDVCFLAAFEKAIQNGAQASVFQSVERYQRCSLFVRCMFDVCIQS